MIYHEELLLAQTRTKQILPRVFLRIGVDTSCFVGNRPGGRENGNNFEEFMKNEKLTMKREFLFKIGLNRVLTCSKPEKR